MIDNYDIWAAHDAAQEAKLMRRPICSMCGEHIQDEYAVKIGDDLYCDDCIDSMKVPTDDD